MMRVAQASRASLGFRVGDEITRSMDTTKVMGNTTILLAIRSVDVVADVSIDDFWVVLRNPHHRDPKPIHELFQACLKLLEHHDIGF